MHERDTFAKFFLDLAKLVFGGMVIGLLTPLIRGEAPQVDWLICGIGVIVVVLFAVTALIVYRYKNNTP
jgi:hypothetical protein